MSEKLDEIEKTALEALASVQDKSGMEEWRVARLGRSSALMQVFGGLGALSKEERPVIGQSANRVELALESTMAEKTEAIRRSDLERSLSEERLDVTLPGRPIHHGRLHPSTQQFRRVLAILAEMNPGVYLTRGGNR